MYELIATTTFGLEAVARREIEKLGYEVTRTEDGKVTFLGDERAIVRANLWLRTSDRVLLKMAEFRADESEDLFQGVKKIAWEDYLPEDARCIVTCSTVKSKLRSEPNNQKTVKKAIVERLQKAYGLEGKRLPETGAVFTCKVTLLKDIATITMDTSGEALHKRGYRVAPIAAPLKETLAAALVELSFYRAGRTLIDPCGGSGTIAIEAALIERNIAPGICTYASKTGMRRFVSEDWGLIPRELWEEEREACIESINDASLDITLCDIDPEAVSASKKNAEAAGVSGDIRFEEADIKDSLPKIASQKQNGIVITNPPYGERIGDQKALDKVLFSLGELMRGHDDWSVFVISPDKKTEEKTAGRRADRRRKLYNGNIEVCYYQFHGRKPDRS